MSLDNHDEIILFDKKELTEFMNIYKDFQKLFQLIKVSIYQYNYSTCYLNLINFLIEIKNKYIDTNIKLSTYEANELINTYDFTRDEFQNQNYITNKKSAITLTNEQIKGIEDFLNKYDIIKFSKSYQNCKKMFYYYGGSEHKCTNIDEHLKYLLKEYGDNDVSSFTSCDNYVCM